MDEQNQSLQEIKEIRKMMERSSRFISLSGLSGITAGICALAAGWLANRLIIRAGGMDNIEKNYANISDKSFGSDLLAIALITLLAAVALAFIFTYIRSRKNGVPLWGSASRRLLFAVSIPLIAGGFYLLRQLQLGDYGLIAPGCLIFYGLALVNASKYTFGEVKYLGYAEILLGLISCWKIDYGIHFWAIGFGVFHILYGTLMWWKYERDETEANE